MDIFGKFLNQHGFFLTLSIVWPILSGILNVLFHFKSPEGWVAWSEKNPKLAVINRMIRAAGLDPLKLIESCKDFIELMDKKTDSTKHCVSSDKPKVEETAPCVNPPSDSEILDKVIQNAISTSSIDDKSEPIQEVSLSQVEFIDPPKKSKPKTKPKKSIKSVRSKKSVKS